MRRPFDAGELERRLAVLRRLPPSLYDLTVTHPHGDLATRARGLLAWRGALLRGRLPSNNDAPWPGEDIRTALLDKLEGLNIARFCKDQPELTDALLVDILKAVEKYALAIDRRTSELFEEMHRLEQLKREEARVRQEAERREVGTGPPLNRVEPAAETAEVAESGESSGGQTEDRGPSAAIPQLDADTLDRLREEAKRLARSQVAEGTAVAVHDAWDERARLWAELADVFGELGELLGRGWDFCRGILKTVGWFEVVRLQKLMERLPALGKIVRSLGRLHANPESAEETPVAERIFRAVRRAEKERHEIRSPFAPMETRGVTRSDDITRMLPSEAAMLGHPTLRRLWHARRAEHTLITYRVEGVFADHAITAQDSAEEIEAPPPPRTERGPILVCVDTSGSMHGTPESVAKAIALEAVRVAHEEKRACHLYLFSGPGDVVEHTLVLTAEGLSNLLAFLTFSFSGGTDVSEPLRRAVERLRQAEWQRADILILSDGEFPVPQPTVEALRRARDEHGLRVHGILIGSARREAMGALTDHLHVFTDWAGVLSG